MKKLIKTISRLGILALIAGFTLQTTPVDASFAFNGRTEDCDTVSVINDTTGQGFAQPCWNGRNITVRPGDEFTLKVYARNTGSSAASNVGLGMSQMDGQIVVGGRTESISGRILVNGSTQTYENVSIAFTGTGNIRLELVNSELEKYSNGVSTGKTSLGSAVFGSGLTVYSSMPADLGTWVTAKARFRAVAVTGGGNNNTTLNISTDRAEVSGGNVTFTGSYSTNQSGADVHFNYRKVGNSTISSTTKQARNSSASSFTANVNGLSSGNYEVQACAATTGAADCAAWKSFTISGGNVDNNATIQVSTDQAQVLSSRDGNVRFTGSYSTNRSGADVHFNYRQVGNSVVVSTNKQARNGSAGNFTAEVNNLVSGNYEVQACAATTGAADCAAWKSFSISRDNNDNDNNRNLRVNTLSPTINSERNGNVTLRGEYNRNNNGTARTYFEFRGNTLNSGSYSGSSREFDYYVTGLNTGTYEYKACVENNTERVCGNWRSFSISRDTYVPPVQDNSRPTVTTLSAIQRTQNSVAVDGVFNMQSCAGSTWFEYGTTQSLGNSTGKISRSSYVNGSMAQFINGLAPNTVYYYRAVAENCNGITQGNILSVTTTTGSIVVNPPKGGDTTIKVVKNIGAGSQYIRLMIDNGRDSVMKGDNLMYDVYWENITSHTVHNLVLEVSFPEGLEILNTDQGQLDRAANKVYLNIDKLEGHEKDDMTIRAQVVGTRVLRDNDSITARAILAFENPTVERAYENAIAYDSDTYFLNQNTVGASFFGAGFLPATLAGWIFLILLLILVLVIIRYVIRREEHHHYYKTPVAGATHESSESNDDYIPYRPTPKE